MAVDYCLTCAKDEIAAKMRDERRRRDLRRANEEARQRREDEAVLANVLGDEQSEGSKGAQCSRRLRLTE